MITDVVVGNVYIAKSQGKMITPITRYVEVIWDDGENIHYRLDGEDLVKQTSKIRFLEILNGV
jgi:hypothetical protein